MEQHFPVLVVLVPMLAAPIAVIFARGGLAWFLALVSSLASLYMSAVMLMTVLDVGVISYHIGDWAPPWGIEYRIDRLSALVALLLSGVSVAVLPFARRSVKKEIALERQYLLYTCWSLCLSGLIGMTVTGDAFNVFVFLEISALSTYALVSIANRRQAHLAAFRYLIAGTVGATFLLIGIGLLYMQTGTLNMADLAERLPDVAGTRPVIAGLGFVIVGIALKMAMFPVHGWLPGAYSRAPVAVSAFLAGTATKVSAYLLVRFTYTVFGADFTFGTLNVGTPIILLGAAGAVVGSIAAMHASDLKRLLAFSSVAQIGYMGIGIGIATVEGLGGGMLHVFNHALMKVALFIGVGCVLYGRGSVALESFSGLGKQMPIAMGAFTVAALSLIGVPGTAGFVSKWYLVVAALESGWWPVAMVIMVTSLMAVVYMGKILERIWLGQPSTHVTPDVAHESRVPTAMFSMLYVLAFANIYFGLETSLTVGVVLDAARELIGQGG